MSFLSKLFGKFQAFQEVAPDDDPDVKSIRQSLRDGNWAAVQCALERFIDSGDREYVIEYASMWPGRPEFFDRWTRAEPKCAQAYLFRGAHSIQWAWEARTGKQADKVAESAWPLFFERLMQAKEDLERAAELDRTETACHGLMITAAMGLQLEKDIVLGILAEAKKRDPENHSAHSRAIWYLCKKWHGSHEEMFGFARDVCRNLKGGSHLQVLTCYAYVERWLYAFAFDQNDEEASGVFKGRLAQDEIVRAYQNGPGSSDYRPNKMTHHELNFFAFCLERAGKLATAKSLFERIGRRYSKYPWNMLGGAQTFAACRKHAGL